LEIYFDFDELYKAIEKIHNYKYTVLPSFITIKSSIYRLKNEPEYEINKRHLNDFLAFSEDLLASIKGLVGVNSQVVSKKKIFDAKNEINIIRKRIQKNAKIIGTFNINSAIEGKRLSKNNSQKMIKQKKEDDSENSKIIKSKLRGLFNKNRNNLGVNFYDINCLDIQPGRLKIVDRDGISYQNNQNQIRSFKSMNEVITDIKALNNTLKNENNQEVIDLLKLIPTVEDAYSKLESKINPKHTVRQYIDVRKNYKKLNNNS
jgi:hypothetical protein